MHSASVIVTLAAMVAGTWGSGVGIVSPLVATPNIIGTAGHYPAYSSQYSVSDAVTGDQKSASETRDGDVTKGSYSLLQPDGVIRTVNYISTPLGGFQAQVINSGAATHPAYIPGKGKVAALVQPAIVGLGNHIGIGHGNVVLSNGLGLKNNIGLGNGAILGNGLGSNVVLSNGLGLKNNIGLGNGAILGNGLGGNVVLSNGLGLRNNIGLGDIGNGLGLGNNVVLGNNLGLNKLGGARSVIATQIGYGRALESHGVQGGLYATNGLGVVATPGAAIVG